MNEEQWQEVAALRSFGKKSPAMKLIEYRVDGDFDAKRETDGLKGENKTFLGILFVLISNDFIT